LAGEFEVNRNTVMRTYSNLEEAGIFDNKRGIGFFVSEKAAELVRVGQKNDFHSHDLPEFIIKVKLLRLNSHDLSDLLSAIHKND